MVNVQLILTSGETHLLSRKYDAQGLAYRELQNAGNTRKLLDLETLASRSTEPHRLYRLHYFLPYRKKQS